jgi:protein SCO1/2
MNRRLLVILTPLVLAAGVALVVAIGVGRGGGSAAPRLRAEPIDPPVQAPATSGANAAGGTARLEKGRPALVTFLYAHCPDVCPLIAERVADALDALGPANARRVQALAISVDPKGDTRSVVRRFLRQHRLSGRMEYIVGSKATLRPLWSKWGVVAQVPGRPTSLHSALVVLVDRRGREVGRYPGGIPVPAADLAADLRALL